LRLAIAIAVVTLAPSALANPLDAFGFGSRGAAMASAQAADATDFSANYYNPAGLVRGEGLTLHAGWFYADSDLALDGKDTDVDPVHGLVAGLAAPGRAFGIPIAFGLGLHLPDDRVSRVRSIRQQQPRWELYDNRNQRLFLAANLAIEPLEGLAIGGGLSFMSSTEGTLDVSGDVGFPDADSSVLRHRVDADLTAVRYPQAGIRWAPADWIELGLAYRGEFQLGLDIVASLRGRVVTETGCAETDCEVADGVLLLESRSVNAFLPQEVVFGTAVRPDDQTRVAFDLEWMDWSAYESTTAHVAYDLELDVHLANFQVPPIPGPSLVVAPRFHDTWIPRLGAERLVPLTGRTTLAARLGWAFEPSPAPPQTGLTNFVDADRHHLTAGVGLAIERIASVLPGPLRLDAHVQLIAISERRIQKTSPVDPVGDYTADGIVMSYGATLGAEFR
jgi:long-chain fatty acid transport protein